MILEGIVTTHNEDGTVNVSPMGPDVGDGAVVNQFVLKPFNTSQTYQNLKRSGVGVLHITDDVLLIARAAIHQLTDAPTIDESCGNLRLVLGNACRWFEFEVVELDDEQQRTRIQCKTTQQGEFLEACAEASRSELPVLFVIQDNKWAISTQTTQKTFYSLPDGRATEFYGIPICYADGRNVVEADEVFRETVAGMRQDRKPRIIVLELERLASHTNADDQRIYRDEQDLAEARANSDPITILQQRLLAMDFNVPDRPGITQVTETDTTNVPEFEWQHRTHNETKRATQQLIFTKEM